MITAEQLKTFLNLEPLPLEGGYYAVTYRSDEFIPRGALPERYDGDRALSNAIYYLLTPDTFSAMHRLLTDETYHFYLGDPVEMLQLWPDGSAGVVTLGPDIMNGMRIQLTVPRGIWQGSRLLPSGRFALMGTTLSPGFEFADYEQGRRGELMRSYPEARDLILSLTR